MGPPADLSQFFRAVVTRLQGEKVSFAVAGGLAMSIYRLEQRLTQDIDIVLLAGEHTLEFAEEFISSFGLTPRIARRADLEGGPKFAIKRKNTKPYIVVGRVVEDANIPGLDFILPAMPWATGALRRAQENRLDYGFGPVPTLTFEDMILAKLQAIRDDSRRFKDFDDLQSAFAAAHPIDLKYLSGAMRVLDLSVPDALKESTPKALWQISRSVEKKMKRSARRIT